MRVADFHFDLPEDLIAQHPPAVRGSSRMLVLDRAADPNPGSIQPTFMDDLFANLPSYLRSGDLLVLNDSRVLPTRLFATRAGLTTQHNSPLPSGLVEVLLTEQLTSNQKPAENIWRALVKPARKVQMGETLIFAPTYTVPSRPRSRSETAAPPPALTAEVIGAGDFGERTLRFAPVPDFNAILARIGHMPLPPYIHRNQAHGDRATPTDTSEDRVRYQTVYAQQAAGQTPGSAAAPTAGLHFTPEILAALERAGVEIAYLTLHVGLGTFQPVRVTELSEIRLHAERYTLSAATADAIHRALAGKRRILAVGTTTTRTLEHIALEAERAAQPHIQAHSGTTSIFLAPGHTFRIVSGLLTNFHLPESTLLMLVAAFLADRADPDQGRQTILAAYAHAIQQHYRFFSYGDCMLILSSHKKAPSVTVR